MAEPTPAELRAALQRIVDALMVPGPNPAYHYEQAKRLRREWPTLLDAIQDAHGLLTGHPTRPRSRR